MSEYLIQIIPSSSYQGKFVSLSRLQVRFNLLLNRIMWSACNLRFTVSDYSLISRHERQFGYHLFAIGKMVNKKRALETQRVIGKCFRFQTFLLLLLSITHWAWQAGCLNLCLYVTNDLLKRTGIYRSSNTCGLVWLTVIHAYTLQRILSLKKKKERKKQTNKQKV